MQLKLSRRSTLRLLSASAVASSGLLAGCDSTPAVIKIGVAQPLSGNLAALGQDLLNGVNLAAEEINKEGYKVKGKTVTFEIVAVDDKANAETGKAVAQQLVDAGVVAVIGHLNSGVSIAAAPIYAGRNIAQLAISTNPKFTQLGLDTTFRLVANDTLQAKAIGSYSASQISGTRYALQDDSTTYGKELAEGAEVQLKLAKKEIVLKQSFDDKTVDFDAFAAKLKAENVQVLVTTVSDFQVVALIEALKKLDYTGITILGADTAKTPDMLKGGGGMKGLFVTSPILEAREFTAGAAFLDKYRAKFKKDPAYAGHYTYDAMHVLAAAIRRAESSKAADITAMLKKLDGYAPVTGSMKWDDKGEQRYGVIGVYSGKGGLWESQMRSDSW
ncbi:LivK ABC-type branched-chain amino acid transport systems, periplasmic component [Comamonadaceae bacterium]|uniref:Branched-chain amino acid ABC transporter substrate-binding protein n=1 Tax=Rhodoferax potami TaxID=3068338 RepID=A0ABU3KJI0_9BURK|nr:branched-chain amino acid ABC transporter substrate-binding protein [Rhodoferax sp. TBRC 17660]MDT7517835.1 branched-chain amino acid ABC transporter substrate-binding protein [Rhodoferax sp. TBRC 17660]